VDDQPASLGWVVVVVEVVLVRVGGWLPAVEPPDPELGCTADDEDW
jgi:hypothetical protein